MQRPLPKCSTADTGQPECLHAPRQWAEQNIPLLHADDFDLSAAPIIAAGAKISNYAHVNGEAARQSNKEVFFGGFLARTPQTILSNVNFVTISHPKDANSANFRRLVRSLVMKDFQNRKRQRKIDVLTTERHPRPSTGLEAYDDVIGSENRLRRHVGKNPIRKTDEVRAIWTSNITRKTSPLCLLGAGRIDPFNSFPVPASRREHMLIDYFVTIGYRELDINAPLHYEHATLRILFPAAMQDSLLFSSLLMVIGRIHSRFRPSMEGNEVALRYKANVIRGLRIAIGDPIFATSDEVLVTMLTLMSDDFMTLDFRALNYQAQAIKHVVDQRGGLHSLGLNGFLQFRILSMDLSGAMMGYCELLYEHQYNMNRKPLGIVSPGFKHQQILSNINIDLLRILSNAAEVAKALEPQADRGTEIFNNSIRNASYDLAVDTKLYIVKRRRFVGTEVVGQLNVESVVSCCAEVFVSRFIQKFPVGLWGGGVRFSRKLVELQEMAQKSMEPCYLELAIWAAFVMSAAISTVTMSHWARVMVVAFDKLQLETWNDLKGILKKFLWIEERCDELARLLWNEMKQVMHCRRM